ncbi:MAG: NifU family protein [Gemmatimonadaceae bacterium]
MNTTAVTSFRPLDERNCHVVLGRSVPSQDEGVFSSPEAATGHPVAQALFCVRGILSISIDGGDITVTKDSPTPWEALEKPIRYALATAVARIERAAQTGAAAGEPLNDNQMYDLIQLVFHEQINPSIASHGGKIELLDVQDAVATVRMSGGCQGCGMASVTLRQGIETTLRQLVPGLAGLTDITNHSAGTNPYFAAAKK